MFKKIKLLLLAGVLTIGAAGCSSKANEEVEVIEDETKITLILDEGGVNDQSFNQSAWEGALKAKEDLGVEVNYIEAKQESDYATNIETAIDQESDLIIGVGFKLADAIREAAENYPEEKFAAIDCSYEEIPENVVPILFNEEQAGYSVGLIAANITETNTVGFIGGMEIPSVTNFLVGFEKAIQEENVDVKVLSQYANSFTDGAKGKAIAQQMIKDNADIIFTAGGGVNNGAWEACVEAGIKAIGVDMPSSQFSPSIITSALKNVGTGVEIITKDLIDGNFKGGQVKMFDLSNGGVGFEKTELLQEDLVKYVEDKLNK
jgi:basic membrane protein A